MSPEDQPDASRLAAEVVAALRERGLRLAVAESSSGGLIGHLITEVPGSSAVFPGGVVAYANALKERLGVPSQILREHGAVSAEAAEAMASAVREWAGADIGIAETGIAGPTGGSNERPVGLFYVAVADGKGSRSRRVEAQGGRSANKLASACAALALVRERLAR